ncbi:adenylyl-sulfate kinase [Litorilinea aerophila]|uniref:Adenylyl-sulfate kinase n=1 Tax=Litorilinea aerophila TaxID=1204385 RepID=A0A540VAJ8_9CHLR|nr:adenylyl-sulfate kinase [Litorilinea aerophila]MCC9078371.1 adenylyl-sulfate kinase [Litorilinea aerophila]
MGRDETSPGWAVWFTGLPAAGKTTLARTLQRRLAREGICAVLLDSDELRPILTPQPTFTPGEREDFYRRLTQLAATLVEQGVHVLIAATGNRQHYRDFAARLLPHLALVWVRCAPETCRRRDPKGLYRRALAGEIRNFPGVDAAYEPPAEPVAVVDTDREGPDQAVERLLVTLPFLRSGDSG